LAELVDQDLFALIAKSFPGGVLMVDAGGLICFASDEAERQFGFAHDELRGERVSDLLPGLNPEILETSRRAPDDSSTTQGTEAARHQTARRRDGRMFPVEIAVRTVATATGHYVVVVVTDITARLETESCHQTALEEQLEFERLVAELSTQFINLPIERVDDVVKDALQRVAEALNVDRATFFRIEPDGTAVAPVGWQRPGIPPAPPLSVRERFPWVYEAVAAGRLMHFADVDQIPSALDREGFRALGVQSSVTIPVSVAGRVIGGVGFNAIHHQRAWSRDVLQRLQVFATAFGNLLVRREADEALRRAFGEVERLRLQLHEENAYLRAEARERLGSSVVGDSPAMRRVLEQVRQVADTSATVLLLGETGTGKELFATQIHELSARRARAMVRVNCAAIPTSLMESELFGHEKGAYTGAVARQAGRFELAHHSTIFLDEIGDLSPDIQVKLLRVLEERRIERLGNPTPIQVDTRIIAATHRNLERRIAEGAFREDLFYRLNVFPIVIPPLRERAPDVPLLVWHFVGEVSKTLGKRIESVPQEDLAALARYPWPGNIRELRNVVERSMITASSGVLRIAPPASSAAAQKRSERLSDVETEHLREVLESTGWRVRGAGGAAECLGLRPTTLETRMAKLGLKRPLRH
jgi:formate hydrogenlyase transcriptional activator